MEKRLGIVEQAQGGYLLRRNVRREMGLGRPFISPSSSESLLIDCGRALVTSVIVVRLRSPVSTDFGTRVYYASAIAVGSSHWIHC